MKELLLVCISSFFGGGLRYLVGKAVQSWVAVSFPWGTMTVNVIGCFLIGLLSAVLYTLLSLALGLIAVIIGYQIVK